MSERVRKLLGDLGKRQQQELDVFSKDLRRNSCNFAVFTIDL